MLFFRYFFLSRAKLHVDNDNLKNEISPQNMSYVPQGSTPTLTPNYHAAE